MNHLYLGVHLQVNTNTFLEQVGEEFNVTRERVRQIEQKVIQKLKEHAGLQKILGIEDDIAKLEAGEGKKKKK